MTTRAAVWRPGSRFQMLQRDKQRMGVCRANAYPAA